MRFCEECGAKIEDAAMFCEECGTPVEVVEEQSVAILSVAEAEQLSANVATPFIEDSTVEKSVVEENALVTENVPDAAPENQILQSEPALEILAQVPQPETATETENQISLPESVPETTSQISQAEPVMGNVPQISKPEQVSETETQTLRAEPATDSTMTQLLESSPKKNKLIPIFIALGSAVVVLAIALIIVLAVVIPKIKNNNNNYSQTAQADDDEDGDNDRKNNDRKNNDDKNSNNDENDTNTVPESNQGTDAMPDSELDPEIEQELTPEPEPEIVYEQTEEVDFGYNGMEIIFGFPDMYQNEAYDASGNLYRINIEKSYSDSPVYTVSLYAYNNGGLLYCESTGTMDFYPYLDQMYNGNIYNAYSGETSYIEFTVNSDGSATIYWDVTYDDGYYNFICNLVMPAYNNYYVYWY